MQKWEYKVITLTDPHGYTENFGEDVNRTISFRPLIRDWGEEGWELVSATETRWFFKRPLVEDEE